MPGINTLQQFSASDWQELANAYLSSLTLGWGDSEVHLLPNSLARESSSCPQWDKCDSTPVTGASLPPLPRCFPELLPLKSACLQNWS